MKMYCSKCGKENPDDAVYCSECGEKIRRIPEDKVKTLKKDKSRKEFKSKEQYGTEYYAGFLIRLGAFLIDMGIINFFGFILSFFLALLFGEPYVALITNVHENLVGAVLLVGYNAVFLSLFSTTPGKALYGLEVLRKDIKEKITLAMSITRPFLQILSTFFFGIGYWNMNKNEYQQAWHDRQVNSVVVGKRKALALPMVVTGLSILVVLYFNLT